MTHCLLIIARGVMWQDYNDEVTQSQVQELRYLNGEASSPVARGGRGNPSLPMRGSAAAAGVAGDFHGPPRTGRTPAMMRCVDELFVSP